MKSELDPVQIAGLVEQYYTDPNNLTTADTVEIAHQVERSYGPPWWPDLSYSIPKHFIVQPTEERSKWYILDDALSSGEFTVKETQTEPSTNDYQGYEGYYYEDYHDTMIGEYTSRRRW